MCLVFVGASINRYIEFVKVIMDFDSPDVEKDFPGLYASESGASRKKDDDDCKHRPICLYMSGHTVFH